MKWHSHLNYIVLSSCHWLIQLHYNYNFNCYRVRNVQAVGYGGIVPLVSFKVLTVFPFRPSFFAGNFNEDDEFMGNFDEDGSFIGDYTQTTQEESQAVQNKLLDFANMYRKA